MIFREHNCFRLKRPLQGESIPVGTVGVVLMMYGGHSPKYEVEFVGKDEASLRR